MTMQGQFGAPMPRTLEDIFGTGLARTAQFNNRVGQSFGNVAPQFRSMLEQQGPMVSNAFDMSTLLGGGTDFGQFVQGMPTSQAGFGAVPSMGTLNQVADRLRNAPDPMGLDPLNPDPSSLLAEQLRGSQSTQRDMAMGGGMANLPGRFQDSFQRMFRRAFDNVLASQSGGDMANFQFLPYLQSQGWRFQ